jgi:hypothetical protein
LHFYLGNDPSDSPSTHLAACVLQLIVIVVRVDVILRVQVPTAAWGCQDFIDAPTEQSGHATD